MDEFEFSRPTGMTGALAALESGAQPLSGGMTLLPVL